MFSNVPGTSLGLIFLLVVVDESWKNKQKITMYGKTSTTTITTTKRYSRTFKKHVNRQKLKMTLLCFQSFITSMKIYPLTLMKKFSAFHQQRWLLDYKKWVNSQFKERFLIHCRKTKTKVIITADQKKGNYYKKPIEYRATGSAGKSEWLSPDLFKFCIWLVEILACTL